MRTDISLTEQTQKAILDYVSKNKSSILPKEQEFAELLGVSRVVVREALSHLRALGIIETRKRKGTTIVQPQVFGGLKEIIESGLLDKETLRELYQLRLIIEIGMADFVFLNKTSESMAKLESIVAREVGVENSWIHSEDDHKAFEFANELRDIDIEFHSTLYEMTGNKSLVNFQYLLRHLFSLYKPRQKKDFHSHTIVTHVGLYNILCNSTVDAFRMAMRLHLKTQFEQLEATIEKAMSR